MSPPDLTQDYFSLFDLPVAFRIDQESLSNRYRQVQRELHPDRFAGSSPHEKRLALQYSALVNEAYGTLRSPLLRALYLLRLEGLEQQQIDGQKVDGGFLIEQMELREKLESLHDLVDTETVLDHLIEEISTDISNHEMEFESAYAQKDFDTAASACVKMQYLDKLRHEAEQVESDLMDKF